MEVRDAVYNGSEVPTKLTLVGFPIGMACPIDLSPMASVAVPPLQSLAQTPEIGLMTVE